MTSPGIKNLIGYGLIALPLSFAGLPIYLHAPDFYALSAGLSLQTIGFALLFMRLIDAVQDPFIGILSDRYYHYRGPIIATGSAMLGLGLFMIFHPVNDFALIWLCLSVLICTSGFSIVSVNVQALGSLWHVQPAHYTKITGIREAFGLVGLLIASVVPAVLLMYFTAAQSFHFLTLGLIPILCLITIIFLRWMRTTPFRKPKEKDVTKIFETFLQSDTKRFYLSYLFSSVAAAVPGVLIIFYVRDYLQAESYLGLFLLIYFLCGAAAMPLWDFISNRTSTSISWRISMMVACITFIWVYFLNPGDIWPFAMICASSGIAVGANLALPSAIVAEIITDKDGQNSASRYYAVMSFIAKGSLALATGIALPLLGAFGYEPGRINETALLPTIYALVPCVFQCMAIYVLKTHIDYTNRNKEYIR